MNINEALYLRYKYCNKCSDKGYTMELCTFCRGSGASKIYSHICERCRGVGMLRYECDCETSVVGTDNREDTDAFAD